MELSSAERLENCLPSALRVIERRVRQSEDPKAKSLEGERSRRVLICLVIVDTAIKLHNQSCLGAQEVENKHTTGMLPAELEATEPPTAKELPQPLFVAGRATTECARGLFQEGPRVVSAIAR